MNDEVRKEIEQLRCQKTKALRARYLELFGEESKSSNQAHLFRRIAWRLQALSEGDLSQRARDRAATLAVDVDLRLRAPHKFWSPRVMPRYVLVGSLAHPWRELCPYALLATVLLAPPPAWADAGRSPG